MIYAIHILNCQFVKVGFSQNEDVSKRIAELQTGSPFQILPLFTVPGTIRQEQQLHAALGHAFSQLGIPAPPNEWYPGRHPFFRGFLSNLKLGFDIGLAYAEANNALNTNRGTKRGRPDRRDLVIQPKWATKADSGADGREAVVIGGAAISGDPLSRKRRKPYLSREMRRQLSAAKP
jgi:hypothetical protein